MKYLILLLLLVGLFQPTKAHEAEVQIDPLEVKAQKLAQAIKHVESGGNYQVKGASGEIGAFQFLPSTYKYLSIKHLGTTTPMTPENQERVAVASIYALLEAGHDEHGVAKYWNTGRATGKCSNGINKHGVRYDSCSYIQKVVSVYKTI